MRSTPALTAFLLLASASAFAPVSRPLSSQQKSISLTQIFADTAKEDAAAEAVFLPPPEAAEAVEEEAKEKEDEIDIDAVEKLGRGAAKVREILQVTVVSINQTKTKISQHLVNFSI